MRRTFRLCIAMVIAFVLLYLPILAQPLVPFPGFLGHVSQGNTVVAHPVHAISATLLPGSVLATAGLSDGKIQPIAAQVEKKSNRLLWPGRARGGYIHSNDYKKQMK